MIRRAQQAIQHNIPPSDIFNYATALLKAKPDLSSNQFTAITSLAQQAIQHNIHPFYLFNYARVLLNAKLDPEIISKELRLLISKLAIDLPTELKNQILAIYSQARPLYPKLSTLIRNITEINQANLRQIAYLIWINLERSQLTNSNADLHNALWHRLHINQQNQPTPEQQQTIFNNNNFALEVFHGYDIFAQDARRRKSDSTLLDPLLVNLFGNVLGAKCQELNTQTQGHLPSEARFPGNAFLFSNIEITDTYRDFAQADASVNTSFTLEDFNNLSNIQVCFMRGAIILFDPRKSHALCIYNDHFANPENQVAHLIPKEKIQSAFKTCAKDLNYEHDPNLATIETFNLNSTGNNINLLSPETYFTPLDDTTQNTYNYYQRAYFALLYLMNLGKIIKAQEQDTSTFMLEEAWRWQEHHKTTQQLTPVMIDLPFTNPYSDFDDWKIKIETNHRDGLHASYRNEQGQVITSVLANNTEAEKWWQKHVLPDINHGLSQTRLSQGPGFISPILLTKGATT